MSEFTPSQVQIDEMPFVGTFDRYEAEITAAVIVKALAIRGDEWRAITCRELADVFETLTAAPGSWRNTWDTPYARVDMHDLVKRGFAKWRDDGKAIEFTEQGRARMEKWVCQPKKN